MWSKSSWNIIASQAPKTIKGPKGSSDFKVIRAPDFIVIFLRLKSMRVIPYAAPNQKERTRLDKARGRPKRNPIERPNLASPKPMARPPEKSHTDAKNRKRMAPAAKFEARNQKLETRAKTIAKKTKKSGII